MERLSSREWFNRVDPNLIIGAIPFKSMGQALVDQEVSQKTEYEPFLSKIKCRLLNYSMRLLACQNNFIFYIKI